jgi:uncharacterized glyoxalase superfamily protein PhnB
MSDPLSRAPVRLGTPAPYLRVDDAPRAIAFYEAAFGAQLVVQLVEASGRVAHAELRLGDAGEATLMLSSEYPEFGLLGPRARGGSSVAIILYVADVDAVCTRATAAGGTVRTPAALDPFGDYTAKLLDPCGHEWMVASRREAVTPAEMVARFAALMEQAALMESEDRRASGH